MMMMMMIIIIIIIIINYKAFIVGNNISCNITQDTRQFIYSRNAVFFRYIFENTLTTMIK